MLLKNTASKRENTVTSLALRQTRTAEKAVLNQVLLLACTELHAESR